jgi:oxygen-dependent protoporphyrinogen oxidase
VVVGAGVTGLTVAHRSVMRDAGLEVTVLEAGPRHGGKLRSSEVGDLLLPAGADAFVARKPWATDLCRELGLALEPPGDTGAYLWTARGLVPYLRDAPFGIPGDVGNVLRWPGLSRAGRLRALQDLVRRKRKASDDETLGALLRRRLGDEATDLAVGPLLAGLHAGDVDRLSVEATFPELASWEASQGSLVRGAQAAVRFGDRADAGPMFVRPLGGVEHLVDALRDRLGSRVRTDAAVEGLRAVTEGWPKRWPEGWPKGWPKRWKVRTRGEELTADAVVLAVPAAAAGSLLQPISPAAAAGLEGIPSASTGCVLLVYPRGTGDALPQGTGFVVPRARAPMTACTWLSNKWPSEAFDGRAVLRCYVGAVGEEDILDAGDDELIAACARHLAALLALPARPEHAAVVRWPGAMPQYELGHVDRVAGIRAALPPGIFVVGHPFDGVGVADCVRAANETAATVADWLASNSRTEETVR